MKLVIKVRPNSKLEKIERTETGYIAYVKAPAIENKANKALIELLSEHFNTSKSQITILSGEKSRQKIVEIGC